MIKDSLGDRMKRYEGASRSTLTPRMPIIVRVDGRSFHTFTKHCERPFDIDIANAMLAAAVGLMQDTHAELAYVQSDEISLLLHGYKRFSSKPYFDNEVQKIASVTASVASSSVSLTTRRPCSFDARVFAVPESDVCNYFVWRQKDAIRNSVQMVAQSLFSQKELDQRNCDKLKEMCRSKGVNWDNMHTWKKRGACVFRYQDEVPDERKEGLRIRRGISTDQEIPVFSEDRQYIERFLAVEPEDAARPEAP